MTWYPEPALGSWGGCAKTKKKSIKLKASQRQTADELGF